MSSTGQETALPVVRSDKADVIPSDKSQINTWFDRIAGSFTSRKASLHPEVVAAEADPKVVTVRADGCGDFKTVTDAVESIPQGNKRRVVVSIGPGIYTEKVKIDGHKPFIALYGDQENMPTLVFGGTAAQYGTIESATLIVKSDYFTAVNLKVKNSAPRPDGQTPGAQAVAMRISGEYASFFNCKFYGFQDTLLDDKGKHFFKDCYVEGTVDFICGSGQSIYLSSEMHVISGDREAFITAQARKTDKDTDGYSFVHCNVTGSVGGTAFLGRPWFDHSRVVYSYSELGDVVNPQGWSNCNNPKCDRSIYYGEYKNKGPGSNLSERAIFVRRMSDAEAEPFISLDYIEGSKWLLPPPNFN